MTFQTTEEAPNESDGYSCASDNPANDPARPHTKWISIDPGPQVSGVVVLRGADVGLAEVVKTEMLESILIWNFGPDTELAVEGIASMGMSVGQSVFDTCIWVGRIWQMWRYEAHKDPHIVLRRDVKLHVCGNPRAKDGNIRQALLDMWPATGGGKLPQVGTKAKPGPLYGVSSHAWSALAVAVTARDRQA